MASLPRWCATSPTARHTWPVRVAAIPLHATTIRETHCIAANSHPIACNPIAAALPLTLMRVRQTDERHATATVLASPIQHAMARATIACNPDSTCSGPVANDGFIYYSFDLLSYDDDEDDDDKMRPEDAAECVLVHDQRWLDCTCSQLF